MEALLIIVFFIVGVILLVNGIFDDKEDVLPQNETGNNQIEPIEQVEEASIEQTEALEEKPTFESVNYSVKVLSLIGNEFIDKFQYGSDGYLAGVHTDLVNVHNFYKELGGWLNIYGEPIGDFHRDVIHGTAAVAEAMFDSVDKMSAIFTKFKGQKLGKFYSSGHGSQRWAMGDDKDNYKETFVLYNRMVFDDDFNNYLNVNFDSTVDVLIETDRCFAGGLDRAGLNVGVAKFIEPEETCHIDCYNRIPKNATKGLPRGKWISSSQESETSGDLGAEIGGEYTSKGYTIRRKCNDNISYADYISQVREVVIGQNPKLSNHTKRTTWKDTNRIQ